MQAEHDRYLEAQGLLREVLPSAEACRTPSSGDWQPDLCLRLEGDRRILVEIKSVRAPRIKEVEGQLARAVLQLRRHTGVRADLPVVLVMLDRYGPRLREHVGRFMREYAPNVGWGLMDQRGGAVVTIPALEVEWERAPHSAEPDLFHFERRDRQLFTDLNRWMLKILLLRDAPENQWGGPRRRPRHPTELAEIAGVSVSKAHHFTRAFEEEGYLRRSGDGLRLVRQEALLESWMQDEKNGSPKLVPVRALLPSETTVGSESPESALLLLPRQSWPQVALGGVHAAMRLGLSRVGGRQIPLVHTSISIAAAVKTWQLEVCARRDAGMILSQPLYPKSVFRGVVRHSTVINNLNPIES